MTQLNSSLIKAVAANSDGYLTLCHSKDPKLMGLKSEFYHSSEVDKFMQAVERYKDSQVYFGLNLQKSIPADGGRGTRENICNIALIGMDIDTSMGKSSKQKLPASKAEALELIHKFPLQPSVIVDSGRGFHLYWFLSEPLIINTEEERKFAQDFVKDFYAGFADYAHPYKFDSTFDLSRILRVPGSLNLKQPDEPLPVDIYFEDSNLTYSQEQISAVSKNHKKQRETAIRVLNEGVESDAVGKVDLERILKGCSWLSRVWKNPASANYAEWFGMASVLFFANEGHKLFHEWSSKYPDYDFNETEAMWEQIDPERARRTCESIATTIDGSSECETCPFKGGIHSPVELGLPGKRAVVVNSGFLPDKSAQAWAATYVSNEPPTIFNTSAGIARVNHREARWEIVNLKSARHVFARKADWLRATKNGLDPSDPQESVIDDMLQTQSPPLPYLKQVTSIPVITKEGRLVSDFGYDEESQIYRVRSANLAGINYGTNQNFASAEEAAKFIFDEALVDFPFGTQQDRAHALALMLHDFIRPQFSGPSPLFLLDKPLAGSGASLLATALMYPSLGFSVPMKVFSRNEDELRKQVTTHLYSGGGAYLMDNISGENIDSDVLASVLTSTFFSDRLLGGNVAVKLENLGPWIGTGNNPHFSGQLSRRFIRVRLVPDTDTPHLREGFRHSPLVPWLHENRELLVDACITIVLEWVNAGRPHWKGTPLGSFEEFSRVVGGVVAHAGIEGFMSDMSYQRDSLDSETLQIRDLIQNWWEEFGEKSVSTKDIVGLSSDKDLDVQEHWVDPGIRYEVSRSELTKAGRFINNKFERFFTIYINGEPLSVQIVKGISRGTYRLKR